MISQVHHQRTPHIYFSPVNLLRRCDGNLLHCRCPYLFCSKVDSHLNLQDLVDECLLRGGQRCFMVLQGHNVKGLVTLHEIKKVDRERCWQTGVQRVIRPLNQVRSVALDTPAIQALEIMTHEHINQVPVLPNGRLEGVFSRGHVLRFFQPHTEMRGQQAVAPILRFIA